MNAARHAQVARAFAAARDYDGQARVQRAVAEQLAARIAGLDLPSFPRILEIGCGTGFLTEALLRHGIGGEWLVTDLAADMVARCRERVGDAPNRRFAVLDGEYGVPEGGLGFDLICSSLAMQWFDDLESGLTRLLGWLAPGGHCLFTTLAEGSFAEWRGAHAAEGLEAGTPAYPAAGDLCAMLPAAQAGAHDLADHVEQHAGALDFLHSLKAIGAGTAAPGHHPLAPAALRRVMRRFEAGGARVTYQVATCHYRRVEG